MHFALSQKILFRHCDPAGIVFYPRYFEMINDGVEALFADLLGWPWEEMHPAEGVPTASISVDFKAPSHHGDRIDLNLTIQSLGRSSMTLQTVASANGRIRFVADQTIVLVDSAKRPQKWPEQMREKINGIMRGPE